MWQIIGWIIWGIVALLALSFVFSCRKYAKTGNDFQWATGIQTLFLSLIVILFLIFDWNKLHILWLLPVMFFSAQLFVLGKIPVLSQLILFATKIFLNIVLVGVKRQQL